MSVPDGPVVQPQPVATLPFLGCILVMFTDILGQHFTQPVLVPYGQFLGASLDEIALFVTVRYASTFVSMMWMPRCADRYGRKGLMILSICGSGLAYLIQGLASVLRPSFEYEKAGVVIFIVGRAVAGFFGGTQPVVQAAVTAMSMPDPQLTRTRLTILTASNMTFGVALAPISGALAFFGLNTPWLVAAIVTYCIVVIFAFVYTDADAAPKAAAAAKDVAAGQKSRRPFCDPLLLSMMLSYCSIFVCVSGSIMALPILLMQDSFGLVEADAEQTGKNVANAMGLVGIPSGMTNLLFSTAIFLAVAKRIGEIPSLTIGGCTCAATYCVLGFMQKVWHVAVVQAFMGAGLGLLVPALAPIMSLYTSTFFKERPAQAMAVPVTGLTLGMMFGPNIMGLLLAERDLTGVRLTYFFCGGLFLAGNIIAATTLAAMKRIATGASKKAEGSSYSLTEEEIAVMLQTQAVEPEPFVEEMCASLRAMLTRGSPEYRNMPVWHGNAQKYLRRVLDRSFPRLPDYDRETNGREFFGEAMGWLFPIMNQDERVEMLNNLPHVEVPSDYAHLYKTAKSRDAVPTWVAIDTNDFAGMLNRHGLRRAPSESYPPSVAGASEEGSLGKDRQPPERKLSFGRGRAASGDGEARAELVGSPTA